MSDEPTANEREDYDDMDAEEPRSIFAALWFRVVLGVAAVGLIAAVAVPYVLEWTRLTPPAPRSTATARAFPVVPLPAARVPASSAPSTPAASSSSTSPGATASAVTAAPVATAIVTERKSAPPVTPAPRAVPAAPGPRPELAAASTAAGSATVGKVAPAAKSAPAVETRPVPVKRAETGKAEPAASRPQVAAATPPAPADASGGSYWVQVGAYKDGSTAKRVAARLREEGYRVTELAPAAGGSTPAPSSAPASAGSDRYDVVVSGTSDAPLGDRLSAKGLAVQAEGSGVVVKPPLLLADAVALSKDLAADGLKVQVRRAGSAAASVSSPSASPEDLYRVRVGGYPDHAAALAAVRELSAKGHPGFVARGAP